MPRGLTKPFIKVDDKIRAVIGGSEQEIAATEMIKRLWDYIKANNLKAPSRKTEPKSSLTLPAA